MSDIFTRSFDTEDEDVEVRAAGDDGVDPRQIRWTIATSTRARDGHRINLDKMDLRAFKANPVMLWAHDSNALPIGTWSDIEVVDGKKGSRELKATANFFGPELNPFADTVYRMAKARAIRMASIRWRTLEAVRDPELDEGSDGLLFTRSELLEASIVPIGADALAMSGRAMSADEIGAAVEAGFRRALATTKTENIKKAEKTEDVDPIRSLAKSLGII